MSVCRFFILVGAAHPHHGDGLQPLALLSLFDDKGLWLLHDLRSGERFRVRTSAKYIFDDALLLLSLFGLQRHRRPDEAALAAAVEQAFGTTDLARIEATLNRSRLLRAAQRQQLYQANQDVWSRLTRLRLAAIRLGDNALRIGGISLDDLPERFRKTMVRYQIQNWEIVTTTEFSVWAL
ncbi:MAG: hypothetical protein JXL20_01960 [Deltaproteobacteria bacterium]|nr:hypothetical protein [Deltaproteobacteria bacterium]